MSITHAQAVASLHVMVAVAKADGKLHPDERRAIESALADVGLDDVIDAQELFEDDFDLDEQIALLSTIDAREETFRSAYSLAYADGDYSHDERELLEQVRKKLDIPLARQEAIARVFENLIDKPAEAKSFFSFVADPAERSAVIAKETRKCAIVCALLGAFPVPGLALVTDLAVIALQIGLVRDIAAMHGQALDKKAAKGLLASAGVTGARLAVSNLAKLLPGWGSVVGATTSFASTFALGRVFERHFERAGSDVLIVDKETLRAEFKAAEADGKREYVASKAEIEEKQRTTQTEIERLSIEVKEGRLTDAELVERVSHLP